MAESIKEGICRGKFRFAPSEKDLEVQIKVTSYLIRNSPCERTKNISDCRRRGCQAIVQNKRTFAVCFNREIF